MKTICAVTTTRADFGLLRPLLALIQKRKEFRLQLIASGTHLDPRFGLTHRAITASGIQISEKIAMPLAGDDAVATTRATGRAMMDFAGVLGRLRPDALILLGDRYELIAPAMAALLARIPILHLGGGETTEGALDESIRHAVTKMSWLHFPATENYRQRIIQMGEDPARVFAVGAIGIDSIREMKLLDRKALSAALDFDLSGDFVLATYHPVTLGEGNPADAVKALALALLARPGLKVIFTGVNADPGHRKIDVAVRALARAHPGRVLFSASLGQLNYLSAMKHCVAVVGNSSSGIIEAPSLGVPTINLGERQRGRDRAASVIDCGETRKEIKRALARALSPAFRAMAAKVRNPYGNGGTARRIVEIIAAAPLSKAGAKPFHDLARIRKNRPV